jgi:hypothetical protein
VTDAQRLASAGLKLVTRAEFDAAGDVPPIIRTLAARVAERWGGAFVIYEPAGGASGFLLVSDDRAEILTEALQHCPQPEQASLF